MLALEIMLQGQKSWESLKTKIRTLITGNRGGAVTDKWERDRLWCSALVHVLSMEDVAKVTGYFNSIRPDREADNAGKEKQ